MHFKSRSCEIKLCNHDLWGFNCVLTIILTVWEVSLHPLPVKCFKTCAFHPALLFRVEICAGSEELILNLYRTDLWACTEWVFPCAILTRARSNIKKLQNKQANLKIMYPQNIVKW